MKTPIIGDFQFAIDKEGTLGAMTYKGEFQSDKIVAYFENILSEFNMEARMLVLNDHRIDSQIHLAVAETELYIEGLNSIKND